MSLERSPMETWAGYQFNQAPDNFIPGAQVVIQDDKEIVHERAYGVADVETQEPMTLEHKFPFGSATKTLTIIELNRAEEEGMLCRKTPLGDFIDVSSAIDPRVGNITLEHLTEHTSGLPVSPGHLDGEGVYRPHPYRPHPGLLEEADLEGLMSEVTLKANPGERRGYSNVGIALAGYVLKKVTGTPVEELIRRNILAPLEMNHSSFDKDYPENLAKTYRKVLSRKLGYQVCELTMTGALLPSSGLISTASDLIRLAEVFRGERPDILSAEGLHRMKTTPILEEPSDMRAGLWLRKGGAVGIFGARSGSVARLYVYPDGTSIAMTGNSIDPKAIGEFVQGFKGFSDKRNSIVTGDEREGLYIIDDGTRAVQIIVTNEGVFAADPTSKNPLPSYLLPLVPLDNSGKNFHEPLGDRSVMTFSRGNIMMEGRQYIPAERL